MAIKISIGDSDKVTSQGINKKFNDVIGGNCIIEGFDVSVRTEKTLEVTPGKCFIMGSTIEEDSSHQTFVVPQEITTGNHKIVMHYNHTNRSITFLIKDDSYTCEDNELLLSSIQMENNEVVGISNEPKTPTIIKACDDLEFVNSQLSTKQKLSYSGEHITCSESIKAKTEEMSVKGNVFRNLITNPDNTTSTTPVTHQEEADAITINNSVKGHVNGVTIKGDTAQNFIKKPSREQETVLIDMGNEEIIGEKIINNSTAGKVGMEVRGRTLQNLSSSRTYSLEQSDQDSKAIIRNDLVVGSSYTLQFKINAGTQQSNKALKVKNGDVEIFSTSNINRAEVITFQATTNELSFFNEANSNVTWRVTDVILVNENLGNVAMNYFQGVTSVGEIADNVMLPNGVCDELIGTEKVIRRVGKIIFDGSDDEIWLNNWGSANGYCLYMLSSKPLDLKTGNNSSLLCDKLSFTNRAEYGRYIFFNNDTISIGIPTSEYSVDACRRWLTENPITVWYELTEPQIVNCNKFSIEIKSVGKNIFDGQMRIGAYQTTTGEYGTDFPGYICCKNFTPVEENTYYNMSTAKGRILDIFALDGKQQQMYKINIYNGRILTPPGCKFIKFNVHGITIDEFQWLQIEKGETATAWSQHFNDSVSCKLSEPLRSLPGGIYDEIAGNGDLIRRTGKAIFNGGEGWTIVNNESAGYTTFASTDVTVGINAELVADGIKCSTAATSGNAGASIWREGNKIYCRANCSDVNAFKAKLRANPITVFYELSKYTTTPLKKMVVGTCNEITCIIPKTTVYPVIKFGVGIEKEVLIQANTTYTAYWKAVDGGDNIGIDVGGTKVTAPKVAGKVTLTTPATLSHEKMYISGFNTKVSDVMLLNKDNVNRYVEHFESAFEGDLDDASIKSVGKNMFKQAQTVLPLWSGSHDNHNIGGIPHGCIRVGKTYILKAPSSAGDIRINVIGRKDGQCNVLRQLLASGGIAHFTVNQNFDEYFISAYRLNSDEVEITNIQIIENGDTLTDNSPYTEDTKALALDAPLRRINNSIYDSIEKKNGKWCLIRRTWQVTFDGTEAWFSKWGNPAAMISTYPTLDGYPLPKEGKILCNTMPTWDSGYVIENNKVFGVAVGNDWNANNPKFVIRIPNVDFSMTDIKKVKQWLSENPTTIIYQLANPIVTELDQNFDFTTFNDKTYITTDTAIKPVIKIDSGFDRNVDIKPATEYTVAWNSSAGGANIDIDLGGWNVTVPRTSKSTKITTPSTLKHKKMRMLTPNVRIKDVMVYQGEWKHEYKEGIIGVGDEGSIKITSNNTEYRNSLINSDVSLGVPNNKVTIEDDWFRVKYNHAKGDWFAVSFPCRDTFTNTEGVLYLRAEIMKAGEYNWPGALITMSRSNGSGFAWPLYGPKFTDKEIGYSEVVSVLSHKMYDSTIEYKDVMIGGHVKNAEYDIKIRKPMVINLTKWFGRGNEPSKEWCDRNIKFVTDEGNLVLGDASIDSKIIQLDEPLYSLPNGVHDELTADGTLIRRVGKVILDENVNWSSVANDGETTRGEYIFNKNSIPVNSIDIYCDKIIPVGGVYGDKKGRGICFDGHGDIWVRLNNSELSELSAKGIKQWFKENPTTVLYQLNNPVTTKLQTVNLNLHTYDKITNVISESKVQPKLSFKMPTNLRAILRQTTDRLSEAERLIDELILPNLIETDYERTLIEFDFEVTRLKSEEEM